MAAEVARLREAGQALAPALLVGKLGLLLEVPSCQAARYHYMYLLPGGYSDIELPGGQYHYSYVLPGGRLEG